MMVNLSKSVLFCLVAILVTGCAIKSPAHTGFLSDYSNLKKADGEAMRYRSPALKNYSYFIIDTVKMEGKSALDAKQRAEVAAYFDQSLKKALIKHGYSIAAAPGEGVGRVRVALTGVQDSKWWLNVHPASKVTGAGKGGASMEGEVVDSVTGQQLGAVVQAGKGGQFTVNPFSTIEDVKATIDMWTETAATNLDKIHKE